jgi:hypothetical protein
MNFQMETDIRCIFTEKMQKFFGSLIIVVKSTVEYAHIFDSMLMNNIQSFADCLQRNGADRFLTSADAKCTGIEAASGGFQLYERFAPVEEAAFFR